MSKRSLAEINAEILRVKQEVTRYNELSLPRMEQAILVVKEMGMNLLESIKESGEPPAYVPEVLKWAGQIIALENELEANQQDAKLQQPSVASSSRSNGQRKGILESLGGDRESNLTGNRSQYWYDLENIGAGSAMAGPIVKSDGVVLDSLKEKFPYFQEAKGNGCCFFNACFTAMLHACVENDAKLKILKENLKSLDCEGIINGKIGEKISREEVSKLLVEERAGNIFIALSSRLLLPLVDKEIIDLRKGLKDNLMDAFKGKEGLFLLPDDFNPTFTDEEVGSLSGKVEQLLESLVYINDLGNPVELSPNKYNETLLRLGFSDIQRKIFIDNAENMDIGSYADYKMFKIRRKRGEAVDFPDRFSAASVRPLLQKIWPYQVVTISSDTSIDYEPEEDVIYNINQNGAAHFNILYSKCDYKIDFDITRLKVNRGHADVDQDRLAEIIVSNQNRQRGSEVISEFEFNSNKLQTKHRDKELWNRSSKAFDISIDRIDDVYGFSKFFFTETKSGIPSLEKKIIKSHAMFTAMDFSEVEEQRLDVAKFVKAYFENEYSFYNVQIAQEKVRIAQENGEHTEKKQTDLNNELLGKKNSQQRYEIARSGVEHIRNLSEIENLARQAYSDFLNAQNRNLDVLMEQRAVALAQATPQLEKLAIGFSGETFLKKDSVFIQEIQVGLSAINNNKEIDRAFQEVERAKDEVKALAEENKTNAKNILELLHGENQAPVIAENFVKIIEALEAVGLNEMVVTRAKNALKKMSESKDDKDASYKVKNWTEFQEYVIEQENSRWAGIRAFFENARNDSRTNEVEKGVIYSELQRVSAVAVQPDISSLLKSVKGQSSSSSRPSPASSHRHNHSSAAFEEEDIFALRSQDRGSSSAAPKSNRNKSVESQSSSSSQLPNDSSSNSLTGRVILTPADYITEYDEGIVFADEEAFRLISAGDYYSDTAVNGAIESMISGVENVKFIPYGAGHDYKSGVLQAFKDFKENGSQDVLIMPFRPVGEAGGDRGHFSGLYIKKGDDEACYEATYFDPSGKGKEQDIPEHIRNSLSVFNTINIVPTTTVVQYGENRGDYGEDGVFYPSGYCLTNVHCGAFVAEILSSLVLGGFGIDGSEIQYLSKQSSRWENFELDEELSGQWGDIFRTKHSEIFKSKSLLHSNHNALDLEEEQPPSASVLCLPKIEAGLANIGIDKKVKELVVNFIESHVDCENQLNSLQMQKEFGLLQEDTYFGVTEIGAEVAYQRLLQCKYLSPEQLKDVINLADEISYKSANDRAEKAVEDIVIADSNESQEQGIEPRIKFKVLAKFLNSRHPYQKSDLIDRLESDPSGNFTAIETNLPANSVKATLVTPLAIVGSQSVWRRDDSAESIKERSDKFKVVDEIYKTEEGILNQDKVQQTFVDILKKLAEGDKKGRNRMDLSQILKIIEQAKGAGGISNAAKDDGTYSPINMTNIQGVDPAQAKKFSAAFQKECEACGIYSGRAGGKAVGLRLTFIPDDVVTELGKESDNSFKIGTYSAKHNLEKIQEDPALKAIVEEVKKGREGGGR